MPPALPARRRLSVSNPDLTSVDRDVHHLRDPALEVHDGAFLSHLAALRPQVDEPTKFLIGVGLSGTISELDRGISEWLDRVFPTRQRRSPRRGAIERPKPPPPSTASQRRQAIYKKAQDLFLKDRTSLAERIVRGKSLLEDEVFPPIEEVQSLYEQLFSTPSPADNGPISCRKEAFFPVTGEEIAGALNNWSNSAPGPDGILIGQVKRCPPLRLEALFNILLYRRHTPTSWLGTRTVLIPRDGDRSKASNWRPITISSAVQRLLHRILARRISQSVQLNPRQRGFSNIDGTLANTVLLDHYIKSRRLKRKAYNVVSLDVRKAFDSVPHSSIVRALDRCGVHPALTEYISNSFKGAHTNISVGHRQTGRIEVRRGVKQGDPLSPILFNLVLDELVEQLNSGGTAEQRWNCFPGANS